VTQRDFGEDRTASLFDTAFSPDGKRIAYRRAGWSGEAIWISTLNGDPPVRLAREQGDAFSAAPPGRRTGTRLPTSLCATENMSSCAPAWVGWRSLCRWR
jgi:hypothetical protein